MGYKSVLVPWAAWVTRPVLDGTCPTALASAAALGKVRAAANTRSAPRIACAG